MNWKKIGIMGFVALFLMMPMSAMAIQEDIVLVDASGSWTGTWWGNAVSTKYNIYDTGGQVWGNYIVWRRSVDLNANSIDDWFEPTWLMVTDINTGRVWNITQPIDADNNGVADERVSGVACYRARTPSLWNKKIAYEWYDGSNGWNVRLQMHNITENETWSKIPMPTTYASGGEVKMFGDWIIYGHYGTSTRQAYLIDYRNGISRVLDGGGTTHTFSYVMTDDYAVYTRYDTATPNDWEIVIHNLTSATDLILSASDIGISKIRSNSMYEQVMAISRLDTSPTSNWNVYLLDFDAINWLNYPLLENPIGWLTFGSDNITVVQDDSTKDDLGAFVWGNYVVYSSRAVGLSADVKIYNIGSNRTTELTSSAYDWWASDFKGDKIIMYSNINQASPTYTLSDDYDIYRTITDLESITSTMFNVTPVIIIVLVAMAILGAFRLFGSGANGGLI